MATSYTAVFQIPNSVTFSNPSNNHIIFYQKNNGATNGVGTASEIIDILFTLIEESLGGSHVITTATSGSDTIYTVAYTGLSVDPSTQSTGDLASIALQSDSADFYSAAFYSATVCIDEGLCPQCPPSVNPEDAEDCLSCYQQTVENCDTSIIIYGLSDLTDYDVTLTDNVSGRKYLHSTTSDSDGEITLDTSDFPTGLFSPYNSPMTLTITENGSPVTLTYGYVNYSCIELNVINSETV